jgi:pimeloyl-ACP methyl ester carboxylesterase
MKNLKLADGSQVAFSLHGQVNKTPILLISGLASIGMDFLPLVKGLSEVRQVCTFDNRGMGDSSDQSSTSNTNNNNANIINNGERQLTIMQMATDCFDLLDHLGWTRVHIVGMSMGGMGKL